MITRFHVENYKALRDVTLELTPIHVLIGPNDSGKTSIFEALTALSKTTSEHLTAAFGTRWQGRELVWKREQVPVHLDMILQRDRSFIEYKLACDFLNSTREVRRIHEKAGIGVEKQQIVVKDRVGTRWAIGSMPLPDQSKLSRIPHWSRAS